jgi:glycosyltransferase involved in cell wall biosynthesis
MKTEYPELTIFTALAAIPGKREGTFVLTRKFIDGVLEYGCSWQGRIAVWVQRADRPDNNLDHVEVHPEELPFNLHWLSGDGPARFCQALEEAGVALAALVPQHVALADLCAARHIPLVYITENSVLTRRQIVRAETRNVLLRWRRELWATNMERKYRDAIRRASGVQCNGMPTFNAYHQLNQRPLLYFDTRVRYRQLVVANDLEQRLRKLREAGPLRLVFSGRLIALKGVDHLPLVAQELKRLDVPFTLDICGGGELEQVLRRQIHEAGLDDQVRMHGVLDFETELLPLMANNVDLFVCCHRQGDPACTYLETYSCGVPIVGYANEAFAGLVVASGVGGGDWVTPMDAPQLLARKIAALNARREAIEIASLRALEFAALHTFENTMSKRVEHLLECYAAQVSAGAAASRSGGGQQC